MDKSAVICIYCHFTQKGGFMTTSTDKITDSIPCSSPFSRATLLSTLQELNANATVSMANHLIDTLLSKGAITRVGYNLYATSTQKKNYGFLHSEIVKEVASDIISAHPFLDFRIFELIQLNEFVSHQIGNNIIFVYVEKDFEEDVFSTLRDKHSGHLFLKPNSEELFRYLSNDMIIIGKLPSESPKGRPDFWDTTIEKMLADIAVDKVLRKIVYSGEYPEIFREAVNKYIIDKNMLRRYLRRRGAEKKFRQFIQEKTQISEENII